MQILALIPARMGSSRFPGKPMANIMDKPMIGHVYDNVKKNQLLFELAVATCDEEIKVRSLPVHWCNGPRQKRLCQSNRDI